MESQFGIFTTDRNLVIRAWDAWLEEITSRSADDVIGKNLTEVFPELETRGLIPRFRRVLDQGAVELLAPALHGYLIACPATQASAKFRQMQQRVVIAPLRDGTDVTGLIVTIEDVTARRERELELDQALSDENWQTRRKAVDELVREGERAQVTELIKRIRREHRNPSVLNSILQLLVSGAWGALGPLLELARDPDHEVRMYAALALGELGDRRSVPGLIELLQDSDVNVKYHAIESVARLKATEAVDELTRLAESGDFFLAFPALDALSAIGDSRIAARLTPLLQDDMLRGAASAALAKLGDETIVAPIASLMERPALIPVITEALTTLHQRYEELYGEGEYIVDLVRRHAPHSAAQNILNALNTASGESLRRMVRVVSWLANEAIYSRLTQLLGSTALRTEVIEMLVRHGEHVLGPLATQLESEDLETRRAAVVALGKIGDKRSTPDLIKTLADPELTSEAATALAKIGDSRAYEPLRGLLSHDRLAVRQAAVGALNSLGDPKLERDVRQLLQDPNPRVRECALRIAGYFGYAECSDELLAGALDADEGVRRAAIENLPHIQDDRVFGVLVESARDSSARIRSSAVQSLGYLETSAAVPELLRALADDDSWVRYYAARALGQVQSPEAIDGLAAVLRNDRANQARIAAAEALGAIGGPRVVSILAPIVESEDADLSRAALMALGAVGHPDALPPVLTVLRSAHPQRIAAITALGVRRDQEAVDALQWAAGVDPEPSVREAAVAELTKISTPQSISSLVRLTADRRLREHAVAGLARLDFSHIDHVAAGLRSPQKEVRRSVVDALGRMKHPAASEVLSRALDDEQPEVRLAAIHALRRLGSHASEKKLALMAHSDPDVNVQKAAERALTR